MQSLTKMKTWQMNIKVGLVVTVYLCSYTSVLLNTYILTFLSVDFADEMYDEAENGFDTEIDEM